MVNNMFQQVGNNIQAVLYEKNKTPGYLSDRLNVSNNEISEIITGSKAINSSELLLIANILGTSVDRLLNIKEEENSSEFSFINRIENEKTKDKIETLKTIIDEIILLEEHAVNFLKVFPHLEIRNL